MFINDYYPNNTPFRDLASGEVFYSEQDSDYFMATQEIESENGDGIMYNAVSLTSGWMAYFEDEQTVKRIHGEFKVR